MIEKMTRYSFILLSAEKEGFLEKLQELGLVDITRSEKPVDDNTAAMLGGIEAGRKLISEIETGSDATLAGMKENLKALQKNAEAVRVWGEWDRKALSETGIQLHFYSVSSKKFNPGWEQDYAIQTVQDNGKTCWFVIAGDNAGFPLKELPEPAQDLGELEDGIQKLEAEINAYASALEARKTEIPALQEQLSCREAEFSRALASASGEEAAENMLTVFEGFAPAGFDTRLEDDFDAMDIVWLKEAATLEDNPPIEFRNNKFVKMFEVLTDMYGRPAYNGFDPTPYIAVFFMLFFAFCMGDAGYGLILTAMGLGMKKMLGKLSPLVTTLGIATVAVGFIFHTFFSLDMLEWGWVQSSGISKIMLPSQIMGYDGTMVLALVVGIIHLCLAMCVKTYTFTRAQGFLNSLGTWGWTLLIVGGVIIGAFSLAGVLDKQITKILVIAVGAFSAAGIFLFNDIHRNPLLNIGSGLWETYNTVTGLLGDVLSYLRLYALGLAGAMLGKAFNDIAMMVLGDGSNLVLWLPFILIVVIGHTLNIAMCALGAFVHPLRLNFLEFFKNSGYEAAGRVYNPLKK